MIKTQDKLLTTGDDTRQPGQSHIGGWTLRKPCAIRLFRDFPLCRILLFQSFAVSRPQMYCNSFGVSHSLLYKIQGPLLPWQSFETNNNAVFSPHWISSGSSCSTPFVLAVSFKTSLDDRRIVTDSVLFIFSTASSFSVPRTVKPLTASAPSSKVRGPSEAAPISREYSTTKELVGILASLTENCSSLLVSLISSPLNSSCLTPLWLSLSVN